jgi:hypothetical protein
MAEDVNWWPDVSCAGLALGHLARTKDPEAEQRRVTQCSSAEETVGSA